MASNNSSPAILPISNPQSANTTDSQRQLSSSSTSAVATFFTGVSATVRSGLASGRPWPELVDRSAFSKPESLSEATLRIRKNYNYFRINYFAIVSAVLAVSLLTNPFSLILLAGLLAAWVFLYLFRESSDTPLTAFGRQFSDREVLLFLVVSSAVVIFLTSVGSVLVSALMVGVAIVCLHGAFRVPEDLFLDDEQETARGGAAGFLSLFTGGGPAVAQPPVGAAAARV